MNFLMVPLAVFSVRSVVRSTFVLLTEPSLMVPFDFLRNTGATTGPVLVGNFSSTVAAVFVLGALAIIV